MFINPVHTIFATEAKAEAVAKACNANDEDCTYTVVPDPKGSGRAVIEVRDEDGEKVGLL